MQVMIEEFPGLSGGLTPDIADEPGGLLQVAQEQRLNAPIRLKVKLEGPPHRNQKEIDDFFDAACCVLQAFACLSSHCPDLYQSLDKAPTDSALSQMHNLLLNIRANHARKELFRREDATTSLDITEGGIIWLNRLGWLDSGNLPPQWSLQRPVMLRPYPAGQPRRGRDGQLDFSALARPE